MDDRGDIQITETKKSSKFIENIKKRKSERDIIDNIDTVNDIDNVDDQNSEEDISMYDDIYTLNEKIKKLKRLYFDSLYKPINSKENRKKINDQLYEINNMSIDIHNDLKNNRNMPIDEKRKKYDELKLALETLRNLSNEYNKKHKEESIRMIKLIDSSIEIDETNVDNVDLQQCLSHTLIKSDREARDRSITSLLHLKENKQDIELLEQAIIGLHQIFIDFSFLVESQNEQVDNITNNVEDAQIYVEEGVKHLRKAKKYKNSERKKCCCLATCGLCTLVAAGLGAGVTVARGFCSIQ